jgi:hypothetical protein
MNNSAGHGWPSPTWWIGNLIRFHTKRSSGQEINHILERLAVSFVSLIPPVQSMGKAGRLIIRQAMRCTEYPSVGMSRVKKVDGQFAEVIPIARHKDTVLGRSIAQLGFVIESIALYLVDTHDIEAQTTPDLRHRGVDILVP